MLGKVASCRGRVCLLPALFLRELTHSLHRIFKWAVRWPVLRPALDGAMVVAMVYLLGTTDYLGLGVTADPHHPGAVTIRSCFSSEGATYWSWWWKILFTAVTLSSGFKGGEVTPLFFIGAALGNTLARLLGAPVDLFAGLGFVAVFAGATNTPLACTVMGIELFAPGSAGLLSSGFVVYVSAACFLSYLLSGHSGIYLSQRIGIPKTETSGLPPDASLRTAREMQPAFGSRFWNGVGSNGLDDAPLIPGDQDMPHRHKIHSKEIGQLRIYMTPKEKRGKGLKEKKCSARPRYQDIIDSAKQDGLLNAVAHHTTYGFTGAGVIQSNVMSEIPNSSINLCVELIAHRDELELFCRKHGDFIERQSNRLQTSGALEYPKCRNRGHGRRKRGASYRQRLRRIHAVGNSRLSSCCFTALAALVLLFANNRQLHDLANECPTPSPVPCRCRFRRLIRSVEVRFCAGCPWRWDCLAAPRCR